MKKLLIGCGITAAVVLALVVIGSVLIGRWFQSAVPDDEELDKIELALVERFGEASEWTPPLDGQYDAQRVALYVEVRERILARSDEIRGVFEELTAPEPIKSRTGIGKLLGGARIVMSAIGESMRYVAAADSVLLDAGMGKGEYIHYNTFALYGVLGLDPDIAFDPLRESARSGRDSHQAVVGLFDESIDATVTLLDTQFGNTLAELTQIEGESDAWREALRDARDRRELPLLDPLPQSFVDAMAPLRDRLQITAPRTAGQWMVEVPLTMDSEENGHRAQIKFGG